MGHERKLLNPKSLLLPLAIPRSAAGSPRLPCGNLSKPKERIDLQEPSSGNKPQKISHRIHFGYLYALFPVRRRKKWDNHQARSMSSTHKKVTVRKLDRDSLNGFVSTHFLNEGKLELLNTAGNLVALDLRDIKCVFFVRDFGD